MKIKITIIICFLIISCRLYNSDESVTPAENLAGDSHLNSVAMYLAGLQKTEPVDPAYEKYSSKMDSLWQQFEMRHARPIREWKQNQSHFQQQQSDEALYLFSGVDYMNLALWYPQAKRYIMISLEEPGELPDLVALSDRQRNASLNSIYAALSTVAKHNYLMTRTMRATLADNEIRGVIGPLLLQLAREQSNILSLERLQLQPDGTLAVTQEVSRYITPDQLHRRQRTDTHSPEGLRIRFVRAKSTDIKELIFLRLWISDELLRPGSRTEKFLLNRNSFSFLFKSASYYMHRPQATQLSQFIASRAVSGVQDDSGIPYRYFKNLTVDLHGQYTGAAPLGDQPFHPTQADLLQRYASQKTTELPFVYGYGSLIGRSNLQLIRR